MSIDLRVQSDFKYPIEHLFKAIYCIQWAPELEEECNVLKKKLEEYYKKIPAKGEVKRYKNYYYCSNGLCGIDNSSYAKVILSEWEPKVKDAVVKDKPARKVGIRYADGYWHQSDLMLALICQKVGRRLIPLDHLKAAGLIEFADGIRKSPYEARRVFIVREYQKRHGYALKNDSEEVVDREIEILLQEKFSYVVRSIYRFFCTRAGYPVILSESEVDTIVSMFNQYYHTDKYTMYKTLESGIVVMEADKAHRLPITFWESSKKPEEYVRALIPQLEKIEDKRILTIMKKYGMIK